MAEKISFDTIPGALRVPGQYIEFNTRTAVQGLPQNPQKLLILGPMTAGGKQPALTPVQLYSDAQAGDLFGQGSWAQAMVKQVFSNNAYLDVTVIGVPDHEAGVAAVGSVVVSGKSTSAGAVDLIIGGVEYSIAVPAGISAEAVADKLRVKLTASPACLVASGGSGATLSLTAKNKGEIGNEISVKVQSGAAGLNFKVTAMANGQKNANISEALAVVAGKQYHVVVCPFVDDANAKALSTHLTDVSNAIEQRGCIGVLGWRGTLATGIAFAAKINDGRATCAWYKGAVEGNALIAAGYAAQLAAEQDPAKPLNTLEVRGLTVTPDADWPLFAECNNALFNGMTPLTVVNNKVQIMRAVSTYTKSAANVDDPSLLDITTIRTLDYTRKAVKERIALRFPRSKLSDTLVPKVKSEVLDVLIKLEEAEIIENAEANKGKLQMVRAENDPNRLNAVIPADVVNGLHVFAGRIDLIL